MSKFIELSFYGGHKGYFNVENICCLFWSEEDGGTKVFITDSDDGAYFVKETPAEIMAKIREVQNG